MTLTLHITTNRDTRAQKNRCAVQGAVSLISENSTGGNIRRHSVFLKRHDITSPVQLPIIKTSVWARVLDMTNTAVGKDYPQKL